jgi:pimeloyl-ACP methyl ester carboxylesterase
VEKQPDATWPVVERGHGKPVVFLHGYPLNHAMWEPQLEGLSAGHHVVLLDLPGYGLAQDSPVPETLSGFAESVHHTLARRFSAPAVVVGHSFGGYVALEWFRHHPEQFQALVLTNTRSEPDSAEAREKRLATARRLENPGQHLDVEETARGVLAPATWEAGGLVPNTVRAMVRSAQSRTIIGTLKAIAGRPDLTPVLPTITVPTLVIWGEEDTLIPPAQSRSMVPRIRASSGVGIPGAGHLPSLEAPAPFGNALVDLLGRLTSP